MPTTAEVLREARALIDTPEKWTQEAQARTTTGDRTFHDAPDAGSWCAAGAVAVFADHPARLTAYEALAVALDFPADEAYRIVDWNNDPDRTHDEIMAGFDRAIALAEASVCRPV